MYVTDSVMSVILLKFYVCMYVHGLVLKMGTGIETFAQRIKGIAFSPLRVVDDHEMMRSCGCQSNEGIRSLKTRRI